MFKIDWHGTSTSLTVSGSACNVYLYKATSPGPGNPGDFRTQFLEHATLGQATMSTWSEGDVLYWVHEPYGHCTSGDA